MNQRTHNMQAMLENTQAMSVLLAMCQPVCHMKASEASLQYFGEAGEAGDVGEYFGEDGDICAGAAMRLAVRERMARAYSQAGR